jgi:hypothetical protein
VCGGYKRVLVTARHEPSRSVAATTIPILLKYERVLISLWLFLFPVSLFAAQPKEFFLGGLKKLEQRSHKCVELRGVYVE